MSAGTVVAELALSTIGLGAASDEPIRVFVTTSARGDEKVVEIVDEGRAEVEGELRDKKHFVLASTPSEAELTIDLRAYWKRERLTMVSETFYSPPNTSSRVWVPRIEEHHHLLGIVTGMGLAREMTGIQIKKGGGNVQGAARDLVDQIERELKKRDPKRFK